MQNTAQKLRLFKMEIFNFLLLIPLIIILFFIDELKPLYIYGIGAVLFLILIVIAQHLTISNFFFLLLIILAPFDRPIAFFRSSELIFYAAIIAFYIQYIADITTTKISLDRIAYLKIFLLLFLLIAVSGIMSFFLPFKFSIFATIKQVETWGIYVVLYCLSYLIHNNKTHFKTTLITILFLGTVFSLATIQDYIFSTGMNVAQFDIARATAIFQKPNAFSAYLELMVFIPLGFYLFHRNKLVKYINGILFLLIFTTIFLTFTRGALLGLGVSVITILIIYRKEIQKFLPIIMLGILCFMIIPAGRYFFIRFASGLFDRSLLMRFVLWQNAAANIIHYPIFGIGPAHFDVVFAAQSLQNFKNLGRLGHTHNAYLELALGSGILVLVLFIIFKLQILRLGIKYLKKHQSGFYTAVVFGVLFGQISIMIHDFFDYFFRNFDIAFLYWILIGLMVKICTSELIKE
ncbi:MAG: O-antigen ligase family protein [Bacteroidales bacterium]